MNIIGAAAVIYVGYRVVEAAETIGNAVNEVANSALGKYREATDWMETREREKEKAELAEQREIRELHAKEISERYNIPQRSLSQLKPKPSRSCSLL